MDTHSHKERTEIHKSSRLVLIRLVLTEIQPFKTIKINKEMYGHPVVRTASGWRYISL